MSQSQLRKDLEKRLGRPIKTKNDAIALETSIYEDTGLLVSYNTIRRFFGLVHGGQARESVLDIYAQYLGYEDYKSFEENKKRFDFYNQWTRITQRSSWSEEEINELVYQSLNEDRAAQGQLLWLMTRVFEEESISEWNRWFSVTAWDVEEDRFGHLLFILDNLGLFIRKRITSAKDAEELCSYPNLIDKVVLLFVDYSTLTDGYYKLVIDELRKHSKYDLFTSSLGGLQALLQGDFAKAEHYYRITAAFPVDEANYPILNSRILGAQVFLDWHEHKRLQPKTYQEIISLVESTPGQQYDLSVMEILPMAVILGMTNEVISIHKMNSDRDRITSDWSIIVNLDLIKLSVMIAYARAELVDKTLVLEAELNTDNWYLAYNTYLKALHAMSEKLIGRSQIKFEQEFDKFPGLKMLI